MSEAMKEQEGTSLRRFKPYPAYKDSGVEWLGNIPAHWQMAPLFGAKHGMRRVIDESGEDYLYPRRFFVDVRVPQAAKRALSTLRGT